MRVVRDLGVSVVAYARSRAIGIIVTKCRVDYLASLV